MTNTLTPTYFSSVTSIILWSDGDSARYLSTDYSLPYVTKNNTYYYFAWNEQDKKYYLVMTSERDLQERHND